MLEPATITRPNGKPYRARKVVVDPWANEGVHEDSCGVYVLGTHDIEGSRPLANASIQGNFESDMVATRPEQCWIRLGYQNGQPWWITDEVRGRAAVCWTADYPVLCQGCGNPVDEGVHGMSEYGGCV